MRSRAAVFFAPDRPLEVLDVDLEPPRPDEVVVRMAAVGVCGTDLHQVKGEWQRPTPMVLGHEGAGVVEDVGAAVRGVAPGARVVLLWSPSCGACAACRRGRPAACPELHRALADGTRLDGTTGLAHRGAPVYRGTATGAWSERVVVHESLVVPIPDDLPLEAAALLGCAALTGVGAVLNVARPRAGATVLIVGAGGVGQFCVQAARLAEAATIVCVDPAPARRAQALRLGAAHAVAPEELADRMAAVAPDGADCALDVVGGAETTATALRHTRPGGTAVIVGLPPTGTRLDLDPAEFIRREKWLTGTMYGSEDPRTAMPALLQHVAVGHLQLDGMGTAPYALADVNEAIAASLAGSAGRVLIAP